MCSRTRLSRRTERDAALFELLAADRHELLSLTELASDVLLRALHAAEDAGHGSIRGVAPGADAHQSVQVSQARRVEDHPAAADEAFDTGVKVRRFELICVAGKVARRNVEGAAQRYTQVREVAADAGALRDGVV